MLRLSATFLTAQVASFEQMLRYHFSFAFAQKGQQIMSVRWKKKNKKNPFKCLGRHLICIAFMAGQQCPFVFSWHWDPMSYCVRWNTPRKKSFLSLALGQNSWCCCRLSLGGETNQATHFAVHVWVKHNGNQISYEYFWKSLVHGIANGEVPMVEQLQLRFFLCVIWKQGAESP